MKTKTFIFLLVLPLIIGCVSNASVPTSIITVDTPTLAANNIPMPIPSSEDECADVKTGTLAELKTAGTIVLQDMHYKAYTIKADIFQKVELTKEDEFVFSIATSPNRQLTAYNLYSRNNDVSNLIIMDSSGETKITIPWEEGWNFISSWLDNQRLLINIHADLSDGDPAAKEFSTFLVANAFTGEKKLLQPNFPNIYSHHMFPAWNGFGSTVYNATLDRVVYLKEDPTDGAFHYILWNISGQRSLADFKVFVNGQDIPRWSPDGEKFAIAFSLVDDSSSKWLVHSLYTVSRDGNVVKITDLSKYYSWFYIGQLSWSPDGRHIAFWLSEWTDPPQLSGLSDLNANQHLAVVDTKNRDLSIYCISGKAQSDGIVPPPVWSPNGQQILIESPLSEEHSQVLLLDLNTNVITTIGKDMTPVGWMIKP